jgi:hypothetical protein
MIRYAFTVLILLALSAPAFGADPGMPGGPAPYTPILIFPKSGQNLEQQDRDRYECHNWAVKQTGFDPFLPAVPPQHKVAVVAAPPAGHDTAVLGFTGAFLGALAAGPRDAGVGALFGGITGAIIGAASDASRQDRAREIEEAYNRREQMLNSQLDRNSYDYRRAISACLEGRGYSVR